MPARDAIEEDEHTTHFSSMDYDGNEVSLIYTLHDLIGAHVYDAVTGRLINHVLINLTTLGYYFTPVAYASQLSALFTGAPAIACMPFVILRRYATIDPRLNLCDIKGYASSYSFFFFFNDTATTEIYTLSLHDALPI